MRYGICQLCDAVTEGKGYNAISSLYDHIHKEHTNTIEEIKKDEERYREEMSKIKDCLTIGSFMSFEDLPQKEGRKEHEGKIIK
jgi:hypothetical protein